jgi:glycosyltransferase involved in cell wall biosynthesis
MSARILLIAEAANPDWVSVPLVGWSLARAIARIAPAHLVTHVRNRAAILNQGLAEGSDFTALDSEAVARPLWRASTLLRGAPGTGWTTATAFAAFAYYYFEAMVWRRFAPAIRRGEFDIVHRVTPLSPTIPSLLAARCERAGVPFVLGPLNGGVPWPKEFDCARRKEREWLSYVRAAYRFLPGYASTLRASSALIAGSRGTLAEIPSAYRGKCFYLPENAIDPERFSGMAIPATAGSLRACFVGRLVPYKGPDLLLEALAPLVRDGKVCLDIVGDGPLMPELRALVRSERLAGGVTLHGWVDHRDLQTIMCRSQVLAFPSIREFGGGVVLEAMALGLVPVVVDYAGPGELVTESTGCKIPLGRRDEIITRLRAELASLCEQPGRVTALSGAARARVHALFTWDRKAAQMAQIYAWVLRQRNDKPEFFGLASAEPACT